MSRASQRLLVQEAPELRPSTTDPRTTSAPKRHSLCLEFPTVLFQISLEGIVVFGCRQPSHSRAISLPG
ncbi:hypothetical protein Cob_v000609 [Colletotrichum orbiculare MAFF 240422]|uniref:Uncharacterized protein n=1 Tax=Colletotrichum orbiculare (strain 104-T / ATCC 96160 / CBS 514.97 / LARS 414 / MAFF 240422) TaxID=1213857 RepID=A0A484G5B0_COLOR|nr:hypothetical protein Cob_v000609 [Colletotrichum orbiculare MAFF 240422]